MRATFLASQACIPWLRKSSNPHILTLSPPLNMDAKWFAPHAAYTISKYGMSMCMLGMAREFAGDGVAANCLWPRTTIATAAIEYNFPEAVLRASRKPSIMADAAHRILTQGSRACSGNFFVDEDVLRAAGAEDFGQYAVAAGTPPVSDLFLG
jgi:citronellol/citronellal dehydrogenase